MPPISRCSWILAGLSCLFVNSDALAANPSFDCSRASTRTERAICADDRLASLDRRMATVFREQMSQLRRDRARRLRFEQDRWQEWRNVCEGSRNCLETRYINRINELLGVGSILVGEGGQPPQRDETVTMSANGVLQKKNSDGSISYYVSTNGRLVPATPEGRPKVLFSQAPNSNFPQLPSELSSWGNQVERELGTILTNILSEEEYQTYLRMETDLDYYQRVSLKMETIQFFTE